MLALVGQTAEPNWLELFEKTHRYRAKKIKYFVQKLIFSFKSIFKIDFKKCSTGNSGQFS